MTAALVEFSNPTTFVTYLTSFPTHMLATYIPHYQLLVLDLASAVCTVCLLISSFVALLITTDAPLARIIAPCQPQSKGTGQGLGGLLRGQFK